jgi:hypothetical protein
LHTDLYRVTSIPVARSFGDLIDLDLDDLADTGKCLRRSPRRPSSIRDYRPGVVAVASAENLCPPGGLRRAADFSHAGVRFGASIASKFTA